MKTTDFIEPGAGRLVSLADHFAFLPSALPPRLQPSWELTRAVEDASSAVAALSAHLSQVPNAEFLLHPLRKREAVLSNRIEGTITHVRDLLVAEAASTSVPETEATMEGLNYLAALDLGRQLLAEGHPLHLPLVRALHDRLLAGVRGRDKHPGQFRRTQVQIGGDRRVLATARYVPPPNEQVEPLMLNLEAFMDSAMDYGPLVECAIIHYQFEAIHPFEDGNGRIGRLMIPLFLQYRGVLDRPVLYLSEYFDGARDDYIELMYNVSAIGDWQRWILFFLDAAKQQARETIRHATHIADLHKGYRERARGLNKAAILAIDLLRQNLVVSVKDVRNFATCSYPTARTAIDQLTQVGILSPVPLRSGAQMWWPEELVTAIEVN